MSLTPKSKSHSSCSSNASTSSASTSQLHGHHLYHHGQQHGTAGNAASDTIQLLVDNANFVVNPDIFASKKDTMLYRMFFSSPSIAKPNEKGQYVIEGFSATVFSAILVSFVCMSQIFLATLSAIQEWAYTGSGHLAQWYIAWARQIATFSCMCHMLLDWKIWIDDDECLRGLITQPQHASHPRQSIIKFNLRSIGLLAKKPLAHWSRLASKLGLIPFVNFKCQGKAKQTAIWRRRLADSGQVVQLI